MHSLRPMLVRGPMRLAIESMVNNPSMTTKFKSGSTALYPEPVRSCYCICLVDQLKEVFGHKCTKFRYIFWCSQSSGGQCTCIVLIDHIIGITYKRDLSVTNSIGHKDRFMIERISSPNDLPSYQWRRRWWHQLARKYGKKVTASPRAPIIVLYMPPHSYILDVAFDRVYIHICSHILGR